jgi:hypothetical protein
MPEQFYEADDEPRDFGLPRVKSYWNREYGNYHTDLAQDFANPKDSFKSQGEGTDNVVAMFRPSRHSFSLPADKIRPSLTLWVNVPICRFRKVGSLRPSPRGTPSIRQKFVLIESARRRATPTPKPQPSVVDRLLERFAPRAD